MSDNQRDLLITPGEGLLAGAIAGVVMSLLMMLWDGLAGDGIWTLPQAIATIILGPDAYEGGQQFLLVPVLAGFTLHELTSAAMGLAFVLLLRLPGLSQLAVANAVIYGLVSGVVAEWWLIPRLSETMARHTETGQLLIGHIVFGLALGIACLWLTER